MREDELHARWDTDLKPAIDRAAVHRFDGAGGLELSYVAFGCRHESSVFMAPGITEPAYKYVELALDLDVMGFNVFVVDHRSQGLSGRIAAARDTIYVERFDDYVGDFDRFVRRVASDYPVVAEGRRYLIGNSMGGLVAAYYLSRFDHAFERTVLSVPVMQIDTSVVPERLAAALSGALVACGLGERRLPGHRPFDPDGFARNSVTSSRARFDLDLRIFDEYPRTHTTGASFGWLRETLRATRRLEEYSRIDIPVLLLQAGRDETVRPERQTRFAERLPRCTLQRHPEAKHNLLEETDPIRDRVLAQIAEHLGAV